MEEIISQIIRKIDESTNIYENDWPKFDDDSYRPVKISKSNFHEIRNTNSDKRIAFIDGGNAEILAAPNFSLQIIRTYFTIYKKNKRINSGKNESYSFIYSSSENNKINYKTEIFNLKNSLKLNSLSFDSQDKTIKEGINRVKISKIADIIRRFAEIKTAENTISLLEKGDFIVMDGNLEVRKTKEEDYLKDLYNKADKKGIIISALAKTSFLFTEKGNSLAALLNMLSPSDDWHYHPLVDINSEKHKAEMFFVKLNGNSDYVFKLELYKKQLSKAKELISLLKNNSKDPVFPGYPYGLIEADRFARVSNTEKNYFRTLFISKIGAKYKKISRYENILNAHQILDKIS